MKQLMSLSVVMSNIHNKRDIDSCCSCHDRHKSQLLSSFELYAYFRFTYQIKEMGLFENPSYREVRQTSKRLCVNVFPVIILV